MEELFLFFTFETKKPLLLLNVAFDVLKKYRLELNGKKENNKYRHIIEICFKQIHYCNQGVEDFLKDLQCLVDIKDIENKILKIAIYFDGQDLNPEITLSFNAMKLANNLNLALNIDLYPIYFEDQVDDEMNNE